MGSSTAGAISRTTLLLVPASVEVPIYNWANIIKAGPGSTVFVCERGRGRMCLMLAEFWPPLCHQPRVS